MSVKVIGLDKLKQKLNSVLKQYEELNGKEISINTSHMIQNSVLYSTQEEAMDKKNDVIHNWVNEKVDEADKNLRRR